jgi:hypothetical protein
MDESHGALEDIVRKFGIGALAIAALAASSFATIPAHAGPPVDGPSGFLCGFSSVTDPGTEGGNVQTGEIDGGPLIDITAAGTVNAGGTLTCTIQVGFSLHSDPDNGASASATATAGSPVVYLPPTLVSYNSPPNVSVYLCSQYTRPDGTKLYWHASDDPTVDGHWTTDPNKPCSLAIEAGGDDANVIDAVVCPVLQTLDAVVPDVPGVIEFKPGTQPGGPDLWLLGTLFWDCPTYEP